jgi:hypothetical protein
LETLAETIRGETSKGFGKRTVDVMRSSLIEKLPQSVRRRIQTKLVDMQKSETDENTGLTNTPKKREKKLKLK